MTSALALLVCVFVLTSCEKDPVEVVTGTLEGMDISNATDGITELTTANGLFAQIFKNYTNVKAPNGKVVHIVAQSGVSEEQILRARQVLSFFTEDVDGVSNGAKAAMLDAMADAKATLTIFNTESEATAGLDRLAETGYAFQDLYATEIFAEGSDDYLNNPSSRRDATLEEVLHLVQQYGIATASPDFMAEIETVAKAAKTEGFWTSDQMAEWEAEGSLGIEYFATIVEVYYGMWAHENEAFYGEYDFNTRTALAAGDPAGLALIESFLPAALTYESTLSKDFNGTFFMAFDASEAYTNKSQYLTKLTLQGTNNVNVKGNNLDNIIKGNDGENIAMFRGSFTDYNISNESGIVVVADNVAGRDGTDTLMGIEKLQFGTQIIDLSGFTTSEAF